MSRSLYYRNLNGFRFFAAFAVIICHLELFKAHIGIPNIWSNPFIMEMGSAGVDFFFVLSGFLITSLLLEEKEQFGKIDFRKFYIRRILRIWPLYYLVVLFCFFVLPHINLFTIPQYSEAIHDNFWQKFSFSFFLMPNVALSFWGEMPYAAPIWSIGVEEQFYLFWPLLIAFVTNRLRAIFGFIVFFIGIKVVFLFVGSGLDANLYEKIKNLIVATRMECMGIGGLGACLVQQKLPFVKWLTGNKQTLLAILLIPVIFLYTAQLKETHHIVLSILFLIIVLNGATYQRTFINVEGKLFYKLGMISYGLYLWHPICIGIGIFIMQACGWKSDSPLWYNIAFYFISISLTILFANISYNYFEKRFLKMKRKYTKVLSGDDAKKTPIYEKIPVVENSIAQ